MGQFWNYYGIRGQFGIQRKEGRKVAHHRRDGQRRPRNNVGAALPHRCMESGMLLGEEERRRQGFLEKSSEKKEMSVEKLIGEGWTKILVQGFEA